MNSTSKPEENLMLNEIADLKMKKKLRISRAILIVGIIIISIFALSCFWLYIYWRNIGGFIGRILIGGIILGIILGIFISICGLYGLKVSKSKLDRQKRKIRRKFYSGLILLISGIILLSIALFLWPYWGLLGGFMWGGGLPIFAAVGLTIWSTILMIPGLIQLKSYRKIREEQNKKSS